MINGVLWRTRAGAPWRDLPAGYGPWKTVYNRHRRWSGDGTWELLLDQVRADADLDQDGAWLVSIDGTVIRAHHHAAGARHEPPKDVPSERLAPMPLEQAVSTPASSTGGFGESQESAC